MNVAEGIVREPSSAVLIPLQTYDVQHIYLPFSFISWVCNLSRIVV